MDDHGENRIRAVRGTSIMAMLVGIPALVAALLIAWGMTASASPGAVVTDSQYGFSFNLPTNWKQVPLDGTDVTALLNAVTHDDPSLANALNGEVTSAVSKGIKVFGVGPVAGGTVPNANVVVTSSAGAPSGRTFAEEAVAEAKIELTQIGAVHLQSTIVKNRLGTCAQISYQLNLKSTHQFGDQFYVRHGSTLDIVTVTTSDPASSRSNAHVIVNSWRWQPVQTAA
jgi:hypothetical protein